jgi:hypothetical protein
MTIEKKLDLQARHPRLYMIATLAFLGVGIPIVLAFVRIVLGL